MATSPKSTEANLSPWTSSAEDSRARTSHKQENASASRELAAAFGLSTPALLGWLDPDSFLLRTCQASLFQEQCQEWSESWPDSGMWGHGEVYELQSSEPVTSENESSSLPAWPTPNVSDSCGAKTFQPDGRRVQQTGSDFGMGLRDAIRMWPTAKSREPQRALTNGKNISFTTGEEYQVGLEQMVRMWPTARSEDSESCVNHPGATDSLTGATRMWATPQEDNANNAGGPSRTNGTYRDLTVDSFRSRGGDRKDEMGLDQEARNWPTPNKADGEKMSKTLPGGNPSLMTAAEHHFNSLPAPVIPDGPASSENVQTSRRHWQTPMGSGANQQRGGDRKDELLLTGQAAEFMGNRTRRLNPRFVEWLMGFPIGWTEL